MIFLPLSSFWRARFARVANLLFLLACISLPGKAQVLVLDSIFGNNGVVQTNLSYSLGGTPLALTADGKIIVAGNSSSETIVKRYLLDGESDPAFGQGGAASQIVNGAVPVLSSVATQSDGSLVAGGSYYASKAANNGLVYSFLSNGNRDSVFSDDGLLVLPTKVNVVEKQENGKILTLTNSKLQQWNADGTPDLDFATGGTEALGLRRGYLMDLQPDGNILIGGYCDGCDHNFYLTRYFPDGSADPSFGENGTVWDDIGDYYYLNYELQLQPDGKIVAGTAGHIVRYNTDGSHDNTFIDAGITAGSPRLALQSDGKIVLFDTLQIGSLTDFVFRRLLSDGSPDLDFGTNGSFQVHIMPKGRAVDVTMQPDGKILALGNVYTAGGLSGKAVLMRLLTDLTISSTDFSLPPASVLLYPNPVSETMHLQYTLDRPEQLSIQLLHPDGRLLKNYLQMEAQAAGTFQKALPLPTGLTAGHYFLRMRTEHGQVNIQIVVL